MINKHYYDILKIPLQASPEEIKQAYRNRAKENHPDLFPEDERPGQMLKMMKINQAYMAIVSYKKFGDPQEKETGESGARFQPDDTISLQDGKALGRHKDPAYVYYKQGFQHYMNGQTVFHKRFSLHEPNRIRSLFNSRKGILNLAVTALHNFELAYTCFLKVVQEYPHSMWSDDSREKLETLEKFNEVYQKICENLAGHETTK